MMTIDEAIAHAREVAEKNRNFDVTPEELMPSSTFKSNCMKCAEEHEQLAEWLEELKSYRAVYGTTFVDVYNKAIGDFTNALICDSERYSDEMIKRIAEKLKVVVE